MERTGRLISCICVTKDRVEYLPNVIGAFLHQSYPEKELVILYEHLDRETDKFLKELINAFDPKHIQGQANAKKVSLTTKYGNIMILCDPASPKKTLGSLRNLAIEHSRGNYICQWDDDDTYHPDRLSTQMQTLLSENKSACTLSRWQIFDKEFQTSYTSNKRESGWEGSILCAREEIGKYGDMVRGEDTQVIEELWEKGELTLLDRPDLYVYTLHGNNTWDREHFNDILNHSTPLATQNLASIQKLVNRNLFIYQQFLQHLPKREIVKEVSN